MMRQLEDALLVDPETHEPIINQNEAFKIYLSRIYKDLNVPYNCMEYCDPYMNMLRSEANLLFVICKRILMKSTDFGENWKDIGSIPGNNFQFLSYEIGFMMSRR